MAMAFEMMSVNSDSVIHDKDQDDPCSISFSRNILKLLLFYACSQQTDNPPKNLSAEVFAKFRSNFLSWAKLNKLHYDGLSKDLDQFVKFIDENIYSLLEKSNIDDRNKKSLSAENISDIVKKTVAKTKLKVPAAKTTYSGNTISKRKRSLPVKLGTYSMPNLSKRRKEIKEELPSDEEEIVDDGEIDDERIDEDYVPEIPVYSEIPHYYECQECDLDYNSEGAFIHHFYSSHTDLIHWKPTVYGHHTVHPMIGQQVYTDAIYRICNDCHSVYEDYEKLADHSKSNHDKSIEFHCLNCDFKTSDQEDFLTHEKSCDHKKSFEKESLIACEHGSYCYYKVVNGVVDYERVVWRCQECFQQCQNIETLHHHLKEEHKQTVDFECYICGGKYSELADYFEHRTMHKTEKPCKNVLNHKNMVIRKTKSPRKKKVEKDFEWVPAKYGKYNFYKKYGTEVNHSMIFRRCLECDYQSTTLKNFANHMLFLHQEVIDYECNNCDSVFKSIKHYVNHKNKKKCALPQQEWSPAPFGKYNVYKIQNGVVDNAYVFRRCIECQFTSLNYRYFANHMLKFHNETIAYECNQCDASYDTQELYDEHRNKKACRAHQLREELQQQTDIGHEISRTQCQFKDYIYLVNYSSGRVKPLYVCSECGDWESHSILEHSIHCRDVHESSGYEFSCSDCDFNSTLYIEFKKHRSCHFDKTTLQCDCCSYVAKTWTVLSAHAKRHTGDQPYLCDQCGSAFPSARRLQQHRLSHSVKMKFTCEFPDCGYTTNYSQAMRKHGAIHSTNPDDLFKCSGCEYTSRNLGDLQRHTRIHLGMMEFKCSECDFMAYDQHTVRKHLIKHTNVPEFTCNICGSTSSTLNNLRLHTMSHKGLKPFKCSICGFQSLFKLKLRQHIVRLHPGQNGVCLDTGARLDYKVERTNNSHQDKVMRVIYGLKDTTETDQSLQLFVKEIRKATDKEVVTLQCDKCRHVTRSSNAFILHKLTAHVEGIQLPPITDPNRLGSISSENTLTQKRKSKCNDVPVRRLSEKDSENLIETVADQTVECDEQLVTSYVLIDQVEDTQEVVFVHSGNILTT